MSIQINGTNGLTFNDGSSQQTAASGFGFKNRIINGAMQVDQRNAGAAVTANGSYPVDRFFVSQNSSSSWSAQRSTTAPAGFVNSLAFTQTTGQAVSAGNITSINHRIEGFNVADLGWGTANAQPVTLSFWVRSSLTGTFGVSFINGAYNRSYVASYVINSANTWEYKTVTVAGDQSGTWATDNSRGLNIDWDLGVGTTFSNSAGSWAAGDYEGLTGGVKLAATTGATFYITGVQLEKGSTATSFDYRPYGTELALCQRYLPAWICPSLANLTLTFPNSTTVGGAMVLPTPVPTRVPATGLTVSAAGQFSVSDGDSGTACSAVNFNSANTTSIGINWNTASGRTAFRPHVFYNNTTNAYILGTGCEL